jgi:hypothetical protein
MRDEATRTRYAIEMLESRRLLTAGWIQGSLQGETVNDTTFVSANSWKNTSIELGVAPSGARITSIEVSWDFDADEADELTARLWNAAYGEPGEGGVLVKTWTDIIKTGNDSGDDYGESSHQSRVIINPIYYDFNRWTLELQDSSSDLPFVWLDDGRIDSWSIKVNYEYQGWDLTPYKCEIPSQLSWGQQDVPVTAGIKNIGKLSGEKIVTTSFYLSRDALYDRSDILLTSRTSQMSQATLDFTAFVDVPSNPPAGFAAAGPVRVVMVVDPANKIPENYETNNVGAATATLPAVDLVGAKCDAPSAIPWGQSFKLKYAVANIGTDTQSVALRNGIMQKFYLSNDRVFGDADDVLLSTSKYTPAIPGGTSGVKTGATVTVTLPMISPAPAGFPATGTVYIAMQTDASDAVKENFENNNIGNSVTANRPGYDWDSFVVQAPLNVITGRVFNDVDADKLFDSGDSALAGRTVYIDANNNALLDSSELRTATDPAGGYKLNVPAGTYLVRQVLPSGWRQTTPDNNKGYTVTIASGLPSISNLFGATQKILYSGVVFNDANGNKSQDSSEGGLSSWKVFIDSDKDGVLDSNEKSTTTGSNGKWWLGGMSAGTYRIAIIQQSGWTRTTPAASYIDMTLSAGQARYDLNFGEKKNV